MDPGLIVGVLVTIGAVVASMVMDGTSPGALWSASSLVMVLVGSIGASISGYQLSDVLRAPKAFLAAIRGKVPDPDVVVTQLLRFANVARRNGLLAMESELEEVEDEFLLGGIRAVIDGLDPSAVADLMETSMDSVDDRHHNVISFFRSLGGFAPTMGMVGTVIGLVMMLQNLSDPDQLGSGMALALITTLYGVLLANILFLPVASRLTRLHEKEMIVMRMVRDGVLAIQSGTSPRVLVESLEAYLPPAQRVGHRDRLEPEPAAVNEAAA